MKNGRVQAKGTWAFVLVGAITLVAAVHGCNAGGSGAIGGAAVTQVRSALSTSGDPVPCAAWSYAVGTNTGNISFVNSQSFVDSYSSSAGPYGGANVGSNALVQAAGVIVNNGAVIHGTQRQNAPVGLPIIPVPAGTTNLPLGSPSPGSLNINTASQSITLAPGNYVAANISVNSPGRINVSPAGQVRIWVTGSLNLGGGENTNGIPKNLAFLVTSSGFVNVNSGGSLFGMIYAPSSTVNVNSPVFGTVIGGTVTLNSGSAVHFDQGSVCSQSGTAFNPGGDTPLPNPPTTPGCYIATLNGWVQVQCQDPTVGIPGFTHFDVAHKGVEFVSSNPATPFVYGQLQTTVVNADGLTGGNAKLWSVQNNTNSFNCTDSTLGVCLIQFAVEQDGNGGTGAVCITNAHNLDDAKINYTNNCVGLFGQNQVTPGGISTNLQTRQGGLQTGDYANLAGSTFTTNGQPMLGLVAQFSWVSSSDSIPMAKSNVPNLVPGLYAVVTPDTGLAGHWTSVRGSLVGPYGGMEATFSNGELLTRIAASSCPGDVSASSPTCPAQPALTSSNVQFITTDTDLDTVESNNLTAFLPTPALVFPNADLVVTDILASTNVPSGSTTGTCLSTIPNHLFVRDNEGDNGGVPSDVGNVPFWESPDIFVVPHGAPAPGVNDVSADVEVTASQSFDVYLRVHNDYGCTDVTGISVFIDAADPNMGFQNWSPVTTGADSGQYVSVSNTVQAFGTAMLGPFTWTPPASGHKCLIAAVSSTGETAPTVTIAPGVPVLPPAYNSNQIAQRNLQISDSCTYSITNTLSTTANLVLGIAVSPATPAPGNGGGAVIQLTFDDSSGAFASAWNGQPNISVMHTGTKTTVTLNTSNIGLNAVPLPPGQSPSVSMTIQPGNQPAPTVNVSAILSDPMTGDILQVNGGTCQGNGTVIIPPG